MTSINTTDISDLAPDKEGWSYGTIYFMETALVLGAMITVGCIIVFVTFLQKLNHTMKIALIILCVHNAIGFTVVSIVFGISFQEMDEVTCLLIGVIIKSTSNITIEHLALVSFIRYHLSATTAKNENANTTLIFGLVFVDYIVEYALSTLGLVWGTTGFMLTCLDNARLEGDSPWFLVLVSLKAVLILGTGLFYDYQLIVFLRKQNQVSKNGPGESRLVPWKTNSKEYDFVVPVSASIVSLIVIVVVMVIMMCVGSLDYHSLTLIGVVLTNLIVIIQIALTIRAAKLKNPPPPTIERKLNFHNEEDEGDFDYPQEVFHRAQIEENQFRRDVHSVAGYLIGEVLEQAAEKLSFQQEELCQFRGARIIHIKPRDGSHAVSSNASIIQGGDGQDQKNSLQPRIDNSDETFGKKQK